MDKLEVGDVARLTLKATDVSGAAVDPGNLRLFVRQPDGNQVTPTVIREDVGAFHADVELAVSGIYFYLWKSDAPYKGVVDGEFLVANNLFTPA